LVKRIEVKPLFNVRTLEVVLEFRAGRLTGDGSHPDFRRHRIGSEITRWEGPGDLNARTDERGEYVGGDSGLYSEAVDQLMLALG
jgi:hypothetical protein